MKEGIPVLGQVQTDKILEGFRMFDGEKWVKLQYNKPFNRNEFREWFWTHCVSGNNNKLPKSMRGGYIDIEGKDEIDRFIRKIMKFFTRWVENQQ